ncbi:MAG: hypothetical protein JW762_16615 [Dehalococcoidales bacterium]|nr:hypothetical protein [Dehalococcoidales bacterium]
MANDHQIVKTIISRAVLWVEDVLSKSSELKLKELKERFKPGEEEPIRIVLTDVEEQPIKRPKYKQESSYSGKKTAHDFKMFKESLADMLPENILALLDSGYQ